MHKGITQSSTQTDSIHVLNCHLLLPKRTLILAATFLTVVTASYTIRYCCRRCFGPQRLAQHSIRWYHFPVPSATSLPDPEGAGGGSGRLSPSAPLADEEPTMEPPSYDDSVRILPSPNSQLPRELPPTPESQPPRGLTRHLC
ncbi:unnamed protein product [Lampetra planeri]